MNKNLYQSRFSVAPSDVKNNRSSFNIPYTHLTTGNFGKLIPFYWQEVLPGDTFDVTTKMLSRMSTPLYPVMDNAFIDYYYFFVPNRLVWSHWAEFMGENKLSAWVSDIEYFVPHAEVRPSVGGLFDHLGVPTYSENGPALDINFLLPRVYQLTWNEWFRDQNTTDPVLVNTGDIVTSQELSTIDRLLPVTKYFDYFTAALPSPQKGDAVDIPLGDFAPIVTRSISEGLTPLSQNPLWFHGNIDVEASPDWPNVLVLGETYEQSGYKVTPVDFAQISADGLDFEYGLNQNQKILNPANAWADLRNVSSITVNAFRQSFQMQRLLELQARSGTRYIEIIKASFGVLSPDARLQRPEYLGGTRIDVQMQQVAQTSATDSQSPLGHTGAYSKTISAHRDFNSSFTEHGYIIGVMCARTAHTYQQGLQKMWSRRGRYDYYWPTFAHIGEQPILVKEIYAQGTAEDDEVFGYQEAWADYRYKPNEVTGAFRSTVSSNLDEWHYADMYTSRPYLSEGWINETANNVDRTLAVTSSVHDQLIFDIRVDAKATRVMPLYSIPGMIDHF